MVETLKQKPNFIRKTDYISNLGRHVLGFNRAD